METMTDGTTSTPIPPPREEEEEPQQEQQEEQDQHYPIALFRDCEVLWDTRHALGHGTFCSVWPLKRIALRKWQHAKDKQHDGPQAHAHMCDVSRRALAQDVNCATDNNNRARKQTATRPPDYDSTTGPSSPRWWAVKHMRQDLTEQQEILVQQDLQTELRILQALPAHPFIIPLHGVGIANYDQAREKEEEEEEQDNGNNDNDTCLVVHPTFLILERVSTTLAAQIEEWQIQQQQQQREQQWTTTTTTWMTLWPLWKNRNDLVAQARELWHTRLTVVYQLAQALCHVHQHGILYRDVKPANVGLKKDHHSKTGRTTVQLFDFGLAKQLPFNTNDRFALTAQTGTLLYMAPEVQRAQPYGKTADVYSLAILMHQVLSLDDEFITSSSSTTNTTTGISLDKDHDNNDDDDVGEEERLAHAVLHDGYRPNVDKYRNDALSCWSDNLVALLTQMWTEIPEERPSMHKVVETCKGILDENLKAANNEEDPTRIVKPVETVATTPTLSFPWNAFWQGNK